MRIATVTFQNDALTQMQNLQSQLAQTQNQLGTGKKLLTASDDPAGMVQVNQLSAQLSASQQYVTNGNVATANLQLQEQAMTDATNVLQSARSLALQANNATVNASDRQNIATQLQQQLASLVAIGNRTDSNGNYLFSGTASGIQPFTQAGGSVGYAGASNVNQIQIGPSQRISGGDTGASVFMNVPAGNGTFTTAAASTNTGSASVATGTVVNRGAWVPDTYTIAFTSPTQYQVTNSAGIAVSSGTYADGGSIAFNGIQVTLNGTPATGDQFVVAPAGTASAFSTLSGLITTLSSGTLNSAQIATGISTALQQMDGALTNLGNVQASTGARLNAITSVQSSAATAQTSLQTSISHLTDVDYAAAITQLSTEELSLKAAQESYASIANLSLFNYIK